MKPVFSLLSLIFVFSITICRAQEAPPPMDMPTANNSRLVDSIIKITDHEHFFIMFCAAKVKKHAALNQWSNDKMEKVLKSVKFKYYVSTIYNFYAKYTSEELTQLLEALKLINRKSTEVSRMILTNPMMQHNLDGFVESVIAEKYVVN